MTDFASHAAEPSLRLSKLIEANQKLAQVESVKDLIPLFLELALDVTGAESSSFLVFDPHRQVLLFSDVRAMLRNDSAADVLNSSIEIPIGVGIAGWVARERRPLIVKDVLKDSRFFNEVDKTTGHVTRSILAVPVVYINELLGVIEVLNPIKKENFDAADQEVLASFANIAAVAIFRARLLEEKLKQQRLEIQMETAARIQSLFRPQPPRLGYGTRIWAVSIPARFVGGDLYDVIPLTDNSWLVYVADVADKGLPAALVMAALWVLIRNETLRSVDVAHLLAKLNHTLYQLLSNEGFFVTILMGRYWPSTGKLEVACGGHPAALKSDGGDCKKVYGRRGPALGVYAESAFKKENVLLKPGESILFTTDGVSETRNPKGEFFGEHRVIDAITSAKGPPWGPGLVDRLKRWRADREPHDDLTLLEIWRDKPKDPVPTGVSTA